MHLRLVLAAAVALAALGALPNASAIPPVCIEREYTLGPVESHVGQCGPQSVDVDLCDGEGEVVGPDGGTYRVTAETCLPDPCAPVGFGTGLLLGVAGAGLGPGCQVTVALDLADCTWREAWGSQSYGPVTVRQTHCVDGT